MSKKFYTYTDDINRPNEKSSESVEDVDRLYIYNEIPARPLAVPRIIDINVNNFYCYGVENSKVIFGKISELLGSEITPTPTSTVTPTPTPTPSVTSSITPTPTPSVTSSITPTPTPTNTPTPSVTSSITPTPTPTPSTSPPAPFSLRHTLDNPNAFNTSLNDNFGWSVAISNNYAIVGAYYEDDSGGSRSGKAYIFDPSTGNLLHTLDNPNPFGPSAFDQFGYSVAISDNYAIVGADFEDESGNSESGKAYIFDPATGNLLRTLNNPNAFGTSYLDQFGYSVAISDNYAIVGARYEDDSGGNASGKAYIFDPATGNLLHTLDNPNAFGTSADDWFGDSVAISDNYAIVGAYYEDDASGTDSGKAYIFDPATGNLLHTLDNPNPFDTSTNDRFADSVAISDNYAIVGAWAEDDPGSNASGKAYIFDPATGNLLHTLDNPNAFGTSADDWFGDSVAITDNYAIVGAYQEDDSGGTTSGKAYIFDPATGNLLHTLDNPNPFDTSANDRFADSVAISNNYAIVGAWTEDDSDGTGSGKAYIFNL